MHLIWLSSNVLQVVSNFVKGVAASGALGVLDDFDLLRVEILSTTAQYLQMMQHADACGLSSVQLDGASCMVAAPFTLCVTASPNTSYRVEPPLNLKTLFRRVAIHFHPAGVAMQTFLARISDRRRARAEVCRLAAPCAVHVGR